MRQMEHWLTFWKKLEGRDGKNEVRQGTEEKRTEKGDGKWNDLSLLIGWKTLNFIYKKSMKSHRAPETK